MQSNLTRRAVMAGVPAVAAVATLPAIPALAAQDPHVKWWAERQVWLAECERLYEQGELLKSRLPAWVHDRPRIHFGNKLDRNDKREPMWAYDEATLERYRQREIGVARLWPNGEKVIAKINARYDGHLADLNERRARRAAEFDKVGVTRVCELSDEAVNRAVEIDGYITDTLPLTMAGLVIQLRLIETLAANEDIGDAKLAANALSAAERLGGAPANAHMAIDVPAAAGDEHLLGLGRRRLEIIAERDRLDIKDDGPEDDPEDERLYDQCIELEKEIARAPAHTAAGDAVKLRCLRENHKDGCGSRETVSFDSIESFAAFGHPHAHGSHPLLSVFVAHLDLSVAAVTAAGKRCPASSALRVPVERAKTTHCAT